MQPVVIEITPRPDNTVPAQIDHFRANPMILRVMASEDWPIAGADSINVEIRQSPTDTADAFALTALESPVAAAYWDIDLNSAQWNQPTGTRSYRNYWLTAYLVSGEERQDLWTANVRLANANASLTAPAPPNPAVALTQTSGDARYTRTRVTDCPVYANDAAADADEDLLTGDFYRTTAGGRQVFRKPEPSSGDWTFDDTDTTFDDTDKNFDGT